ncbi:uncharacterized protein LOC117117564 [Anneissia japonica]|uniref:uncharacterized protein LOC117117564 n=1 Tax=Anneissia japonica TaxID=1529436 RepID=UPI00142594A4|nr:uncharacterized protein LOC117117564 [Anneissia japonica]
MTESLYFKGKFENKPPLQSCFQSAHTDYGMLMNGPCSSLMSEGPVTTPSFSYMNSVPENCLQNDGDYFGNANIENMNDLHSFPSVQTRRDSSQSYGSRRSTNEKRDRINERERERMHQLCDAFERLRGVLPYKKAKKGPNRQKLSKISTLLLAQNYIKTLEDLLHSNQEYETAQLPTPNNSVGDYVGSSMFNMAPEAYNPPNQFHYYPNQMEHGYPYL